ncbi:MAG: glycosyltransferase [Nitrososphaerota archaeon]
MHIDINEAEVFRHPVIINVGRMINQKGQWHLIRAFKLVNEEIPNTRLVILGEGKLRDYLVRLINELKLNDNMYLPGWKSNPFKYMARSTLFCLSSLWEGFPNVVVEALACGLPVMSTDCLSGPREILAPGTEYKVDRLRGPEYAEYGILMPVFDGKRYTARDPLTWQEEMWAEEIIKLLKNPEILENYRQRAKRRAMDFEAKKQVQKYFDVIFNQS